MDPDGQMYEEHRLIASICRHAAQDPATFAKELYRDICAFTQNGDVHDDITILALRRSP
jgi:serine phosphatase RsbU (regulator of sigma subunit)